VPSESEDLEELSTFELDGAANNHAAANAEDSFDLAGADQPAAINPWQPGSDVGRFIARSTSPVLEQAQVLIANCSISLKRLPPSLLKSLQAALMHRQPSGKKSLYTQVAAQLLCLPVTTVANIVQKLSQNSWQPVAPLMPAKPTSKEAEPNKPEDSSIMVTLVREAIANSSRGHPDLDFISSLCRYTLNNVPVGDKYASSHFIELVEILAAKQLELLDGEVLWQKIPGLGVVSPISIVFDPVSLGTALFSRHETLQVIVVSSISAETGYLIPLLLSCPSVSILAMVQKFSLHSSEPQQQQPLHTEEL
jgi:hypothetical protein